MQKSFLFSRVKIILIFTLALFLGLYSGGLFEGYVFKLGLVRSFSESEAKNLVGKRVTNICNESSEELKSLGKVIGYTGTHFGEVRVNIKWDKSEFDYTGYPKSYFKKCVREVE